MFFPLQSTLLPLLGALGAARGLTSLDVAGNGVGDAGARLLARALRLNTSLRYLSLDRNHLTHKGKQTTVICVGDLKKNIPKNPAKPQPIRRALPHLQNL